MIKLFKILEKLFLFITILSIIIVSIIFLLLLTRDENKNIKIGNLYLISAGSEIDDITSKTTIHSNDLLLIKKDNLSNYHINNFISYYSTDSNGNIIIKTGKIIDGYSDNSNTSYIFMVKDKDNELTINGVEVIGKWNGNKIDDFYSTFRLIVSRIGFILISCIPLTILFIIEFTLLILEYLKKKKESNIQIQFI